MPTTENFDNNTLKELVRMALALWPDSDAQELMAHYQGILNDPSATVLLLKENAGYIGFIELSTRQDYVEGADALPVAYIEGMYIDSRFRKQGYGKALVAAAENWAKQKGFTQICSDTEMENENSIGFHLAAGFEEVSRIVCFTKRIDNHKSGS